MIKLIDCKRLVGNTRQAVLEDLAYETASDVSFLETMMEEAKATERGRADSAAFERVAGNIQPGDQVWWYREGIAFESTAGYALVRNGEVVDAMQIFRS